MTDDEKLREIISEVSAEPFISEYEEMYDVGWDAMKWKQQQMIEKACNWLYDSIGGNIDSRISLDTFIDDFRKAMMEE